MPIVYVTPGVLRLSPPLQVALLALCNSGAFERCPLCVVDRWDYEKGEATLVAFIPDEGELGLFVLFFLCSQYPPDGGHRGIS